MGCDDFESMNEHSREMVELAPYLKLLPLHDDNLVQVGVEEDEGDSQ